MFKTIIIIFALSIIFTSFCNKGTKINTPVSQSASSNNIQRIPDTDDSMSYYLKARKHYLIFSIKDVQIAIELYKKAIALKNNFALAYAGYAEALSYLAFQKERNGIIAEDTFKAALNYAKDAIKINPNLAEAYRALAWYCLSAGIDKYAMKYANKALSIKPDCPESSFVYWAVTDAQNRNSSYLKKAINSNLIVALIHAGSLERRQGNYNNALELFKNIVKIIPEHVHTLVNIGNVYLKLNEPELSLEYYKKALKIQENDSYVYFNYGAAYVTMQKYREAENYYKKAVQINPNFFYAHLMLAKLYKKELKNDTLFKFHFNQAKEIKRKQREIINERRTNAEHENIVTYR